MDSWRLSAVQLAAKVAAGELTCRQAVEGSLSRIEALEPQVKALMRDCRESALARADGLDARRNAGEKLGPLGCNLVLSGLGLISYVGAFFIFCRRDLPAAV